MASNARETRYSMCLRHEWHARVAGFGTTSKDNGTRGKFHTLVCVCGTQWKHRFSPVCFTRHTHYPTKWNEVPFPNPNPKRTPRKQRWLTWPSFQKYIYIINNLFFLYWLISQIKVSVNRWKITLNNIVFFLLCLYLCPI